MNSTMTTNHQETQAEEEVSKRGDELKANDMKHANLNDDEEITDVSLQKSAPRSQDDAEDASPKRAKTTNPTCSKCQKRQSRRGCSQTACFTCCTAQDACPAHKEVRDKILWKQQVLEGTTTVNRLAQERRQRKLPNKRFRETGFKYSGDTVLIWSLNEFGKNTAWKEEAIRKSERRRRYQRLHNHHHQQQQVPASSTSAMHPLAGAEAGASLIPASSNGSESQQDNRNNKKKRKFYTIMNRLYQNTQS